MEHPGKQWGYQGPACEQCYGEGEDPNGPPGNQCHACGGTGLEPENVDDLPGDCPECGGGFEQGMYGDRCKLCGYETGVPQTEGKLTESKDFDKFMDRIVTDERRVQKVNKQEENNPQRLRAQRYQDRPMNKTRFSRTK